MKTTLSILLSILLLTPVCMWSQNRFDIVISEFMADPSPVVGLPASEWIELKNTTDHAISIQNWRIADASGQSGPVPAFLLQPDSFLIICSASALTAMNQFGSSVAVSSFPSLDNDGEWIALKAPDGRIIHTVNYTSEWYGNALKKEGGWSLEMKDALTPCSGKTNWTASTHPAGGTPGKKNATEGITDDKQPPQLLRAYTTDSVTLRLVFDESLDSLSAALINNYSIRQGVTVISSLPVSPLLTEIQLKLSTALQHNNVYTVRAAGLTDCKGNAMPAMEVKAGLPSDADTQAVVINEILFNPAPNGYDYVEIFNRGTEIIDAAKLFIANRNSSGVISSIRALSAIPFYIFPGEYLVVTEEAGQLPLFYKVINPAAVLQITSMPSLPDDEGDIILLNGQGAVIDEVNYSDDWHFKLVSNPESVALERLDPGSPSNDPGNWHSASATSGYGTPGYKNSQYHPAAIMASAITVNPPVFSPDNDGRDDLAIVQYTLKEPGYMATLVIFDAGGRPVRYLVRNSLLGINGRWVWDGLDEKGMKLPVGSYIINTELFNLQGKKEHYRNVIVLARKLN
jgi:hypothetical protein